MFRIGRNSRVNLSVSSSTVAGTSSGLAHCLALGKVDTSWRSQFSVKMFSSCHAAAMINVHGPKHSYMEGDDRPTGEV